MEKQQARRQSTHSHSHPLRLTWTSSDLLILLGLTRTYSCRSWTSSLACTRPRPAGRTSGTSSRTSICTTARRAHRRAHRMARRMAHRGRRLMARLRLLMRVRLPTRWARHRRRRTEPAPRGVTRSSTNSTRRPDSRRSTSCCHGHSSRPCRSQHARRARSRPAVAAEAAAAVAWRRRAPAVPMWPARTMRQSLRRGRPRPLCQMKSRRRPSAASTCSCRGAKHIMMTGMAPTPTFLMRQGVTPTPLPLLMRAFCAVRQFLRADGRVGA